MEKTQPCEPVAVEAGEKVLGSIQSKAPNGVDNPSIEANPVPDDSVYDRYSKRLKVGCTIILALCGILGPIASTGSLTAVPDIAAEFQTSGSVINITNGLFTGAMGLSSFLWGTLSTFAGRQFVLRTGVITFFAFSLGCALAPNLSAFFAFRTLSGFSATALLVCGPGILGDMYKPTERATAIGWMMSGTLVGPALGPVIGGIIVTYSNWRSIYWFQTAFSGMSALLAICFIPETIHSRKWDSVPKDKKISETLKAINPLRLLVLCRSPQFIIVALASSSLLWNMYAFLTPIVYVINPRVGFTTPLQAGLFYLAPGGGYFIGTFFGGRYADHTVKKWIKKRNGERRPEDRLRSTLPWMGIGTPVCMLIYGWCLEFNRGGLPLLIIVMFIQGFTQLMIFPSLNTYCLDVMPSRSAEVLGGNFLIRYLFGAAGSALVLPAVNAIGIGWFCTISTIFILITFGGVILVVLDKVPGTKKKEGIDKK